ncbi:MAG: hypothetical protein HYX60_05125 [Legionella longbeachae]|nr:hypothetical protein [Legionella longbeachae]
MKEKNSINQLKLQKNAQIIETPIKKQINFIFSYTTIKGDVPKDILLSTAKNIIVSLKNENSIDFDDLMIFLVAIIKLGLFKKLELNYKENLFQIMLSYTKNSTLRIISKIFLVSYYLKTDWNKLKSHKIDVILKNLLSTAHAENYDNQVLWDLLNGLISLELTWEKLKSANFDLLLMKYIVLNPQKNIYEFAIILTVISKLGFNWSYLNLEKQRESNQVNPIYSQFFNKIILLKNATNLDVKTATRMFAGLADFGLSWQDLSTLELDAALLYPILNHPKEINQTCLTNLINSFVKLKLTWEEIQFITNTLYLIRSTNRLLSVDLKKIEPIRLDQILLNAIHQHMDKYNFSIVSNIIGSLALLKFPQENHPIINELITHSCIKINKRIFHDIDNKSKFDSRKNVQLWRAAFSQFNLEVIEGHIKIKTGRVTDFIYKIPPRLLNFHSFFVNSNNSTKENTSKTKDFGTPTEKTQWSLLNPIWNFSPLIQTSNKINKNTEEKNSNLNPH